MPKEMLSMEQVTIDKINHKKIMFCGSSCTGKTTLLNVMKKDLLFKDWTYFENVVRNLHKEGREICEKSSSETQTMIFDRYYDILREMDKGLSISDRSIIDVAAFTSVLQEQLPIGDKDYYKMYLTMEHQLQEISCKVKDLSLVVYTPIEFPVEDDGERLVDNLLRDKFDQKILEILFKNKISYLRVSGSVEERLSQIKKVVFS